VFGDNQPQCEGSEYHMTQPGSAAPPQLMHVCGAFTFTGPAV
jgi:hypothetical protein